MNYNIGDSVFDNWKIERLIGEGAYGKVFEIQKREFGIETHSALKVMTVPFSQSDLQSAYSEGMDEVSVTSYFRGIVEEIVQEIMTLASLKGHPNIVSYEDHKVIPHEEGIGWDILIRMELLTPLIQYTMNRALSQEEVLRLGMGLSSAIGYCHEKNIIHRDIKPENIFVDSLGQFKLGDFGVARTVEKTSGGLSKKGTESYMAPEVYMGQPYGCSVDTYSLGLVLYRLLNNNRLPFMPQPPEPITFVNKQEALAKRIRGEAVPAPSQVDGEFARVILTACKANPAERFHDGNTMLKALQGVALVPGATQSTFQGAGQSVSQNVEKENTISPWGSRAETEQTSSPWGSRVENEQTSSPWGSRVENEQTSSPWGNRPEGHPVPPSGNAPESVSTPAAEPEDPKNNKGLAFAISLVATLIGLIVLIIGIGVFLRNKPEESNIEEKAEIGTTDEETMLTQADNVSAADDDNTSSDDNNASSDGISDYTNYAFEPVYDLSGNLLNDSERRLAEASLRLLWTIDEDIRQNDLGLTNDSLSTVMDYLSSLGYSPYSTEPKEFVYDDGGKTVYIDFLDNSGRYKEQYLNISDYSYADPTFSTRRGIRICSSGTNVDMADKRLLLKHITPNESWSEILNYYGFPLEYKNQDKYFNFMYKGDMYSVTLLNQNEGRMSWRVIANEWSRYPSIILLSTPNAEDMYDIEYWLDI